MVGAGCGEKSAGASSDGDDAAEIVAVTGSDALAVTLETRAESAPVRSRKSRDTAVGSPVRFSIESTCTSKCRG